MSIFNFFKKKQNYNLMVLMGIDKKLADTEFVSLHGLPSELAHTPEMNFWMAFKVFWENVNAGELPEDVLSLFDEQCNRMRELFPEGYWKYDGFEFFTYDNDEIFLASKEIYEKYSNGKIVIPNNVNPLVNNYIDGKWVLVPHAALV